AEATRAEIARLTDQAMAGELAFGGALRRRLALLPLTREHVRALAAQAAGRLAPSVERNLDFFRERAGRVVIISGGFREVIAGVAGKLGVPPGCVIANELVYDEDGRVSGVADSPLLAPLGKAAALKA